MTHCRQIQDQFATDRLLNRGVYEGFARSLMPSNPTHIITIGLAPHANRHSVHRWNAQTTSARDMLVKDLIHRIDRRLYGERHFRIPSERKFDFFIRAETADRYGNAIWGHLHGFFAIPEERMNRFYRIWPKVADDVSINAAYDDQPDLMMQEFYVSGRDDYSIKRIHIDAAEIWTRQILDRQAE